MTTEHKHNQPSILAVDDNPINLGALVALLGDHCDLRVAIDGNSALNLIDEGFVPDLMLLDIMMPQMNGYALCRQLKQRAAIKDIPFIFLSALDKEEDETEGLLLGAADYISKPFQPAILLQRIKLHLELKAYRDQLEKMVIDKTRKLREAEQKAVYQEAIYRELFNNMGNGVAVYQPVDDDSDFTIQNLNRSGVRMFNAPLLDILGKPLTSLNRGAADPQLQPLITSVWASGIPQHVSLELSLGQVGNQWIEGYIYKLPTGQVVGIYDDISEQRETQRQIIHAKEQWEKTFDAMSDCVTILDADLKIVRANKASQELFGRPYSQLIGSYCFTLFAGENSYCDPCPALETLRTAANSSQTLTHAHLGRTYHVSCSLLNSVDSGAPDLIHVARDITEQKQMQEELNRAHRLASIGELAAGVAHEINNPNGLILHNSQLVIDIFRDLQPILTNALDPETDQLFGGLSVEDICETLPQVLEDINGASRRIKFIVTELRDFSSHDNNDPLDKIDINQVVNSSAHLVKNTLKKATRHFKVQLGEALPMVTGVATRLEQVIINLLINASQALETPDDEITVTTEYDPTKRRVRVLVKDTGSGIPESLRDNICDPFVTSKRQKGGAGLGLSVSTRIVNAHNGRLTFTPNQPKGTTFILELPVGERCHATY